MALSDIHGRTWIDRGILTAPVHRVSSESRRVHPTIPPCAGASSLRCRQPSPVLGLCSSQGQCV